MPRPWIACCVSTGKADVKRMPSACNTPIGTVTITGAMLQRDLVVPAAVLRVQPRGFDRQLGRLAPGARVEDERFVVELRWSATPAVADLQYAMLAGAVTGGGLTVIANAPNPAGYSILNSSFGRDGISPLLLFTHAVGPTVLAAFCFWCF